MGCEKERLQMSTLEQTSPQNKSKHKKKVKHSTKGNQTVKRELTTIYRNSPTAVDDTVFVRHYVTRPCRYTKPFILLYFIFVNNSKHLKNLCWLKSC